MAAASTWHFTWQDMPSTKLAAEARGKTIEYCAANKALSQPQDRAGLSTSLPLLHIMNILLV